MKNFYKSLFESQGKLGLGGIVALIILGISLMVVPGIFLGKKEKNLPLEIPQEINDKTGSTFTKSALTNLEETLANQAMNILSEIEGVGRVSVAVRLAAGPEQDYACNSTKQKATIEEKAVDGGVRETTEINEKTEYVLVQGRSEPLLLKEKSSQIKGVLVVAEGARDAKTKVQLSRAIQSLFDLPAHRIIILPKESRGS
ncbi:MAG: hypothetical protein PHX01_03160 [Clostridia bacterium]|nr:hypothetical protein [Clostridia bacterium]